MMKDQLNARGDVMPATTVHKTLKICCSTAATLAEDCGLWRVRYRLVVMA